MRGTNPNLVNMLKDEINNLKEIVKACESELNAEGRLKLNVKHWLETIEKSSKQTAIYCNEYVKLAKDE